MAATATVMATAMMTTGEDDDDNGRGWQGQRSRMVATTCEDDNDGEEDNIKDDGNEGKDDRRGW
jgi:hypothetical protein